MPVYCQDLDYTFVGVNKEDIDKLQPGVHPIPLETEPELTKGNIFIFQHPKGRPKEWSTEEILNIEKPFVLYKADTDKGSSGSPVLTSPGLKLIAIHHRGSKKGGYNKGTLISEVLTHLEKRKCMLIHFFLYNSLLCKVIFNIKRKRECFTIITISNHEEDSWNYIALQRIFDKL